MPDASAHAGLFVVALERQFADRQYLARDEENGALSFVPSMRQATLFVREDDPRLTAALAWLLHADGSSAMGAAMGLSDAASPDHVWADLVIYQVRLAKRRSLGFEGWRGAASTNEQAAKVRAQALAKLTPEEVKALGLDVPVGPSGFRVRREACWQVAPGLKSGYGVVSAMGVDL